MSTETISPYVVGAPVWVLWANQKIWKRSAVAKVYKTGRFVLEGDASQWRVNRDGSATWAGKTFYSYPRLMLSTPENDELAHRQNRAPLCAARIERAISRLQKLHSKVLLDLGDTWLEQIEGALSELEELNK